MLDVERSERRADIVRQFAEWLQSPEAVAVETPETVEPKVGLYQLYEVLAAQRQELKLYTKSERQLQELVAKSIEETSAAVAVLERFRRERPEIERKAVKPLMTSLIEIDEAVQRAVAAMEVLRQRLTEGNRHRIEHLTAVYCDNLSWWNRFWKRKTIQHFVEHLHSSSDKEIEEIIEPFRTGIEMLRRRADDVLKRHSIQRFNPCGQPVDSETMQVIAVVESDDVPPGYVVDVVRPGYLCRNVPLRFADVRAAKTPNS